MSGEESFLPRILSIFYAVLDVRQGPKIQFQVPEDLIAPAREQSSFSSSFSPPPPRTPGTPVYTEFNDAGIPIHVMSPVSPLDSDNSTRPRESPAKKSLSSSAPRTLFYFEDISKYVIPASALCGRLVKCTTQHHRIIGFPVELLGTNYDRREFRFNVCFVFDKSADLSCYEPLVRKIGRVLTACEEESSFLSSQQTSTAMLGIIEQLYEDLSSYAETAIPIDQFNSIELKLLPFYPNPTAVRDWHVPVPLIDLRRTREPHWDLTVAKVCDHIDGVNHVSRIAALADCDPDVAREAILHLLYYQVILISDIFAYSNMYTMRKSMQWLAVASHVVNECGPYVTKPGQVSPDWPELLNLYARLRPGLTVFDWIQEYDVHNLGIDVRRFISFGLIKGFIRRVHRYPILLSEDDAPQPLPRMPMSPSTSTTSGPTSPVSGSLAMHSLSQAVKGSSKTRHNEEVPVTPIFSIPRSQIPVHPAQASPTHRSPRHTSVQTPARRVSAAAQALERVFHQSSRATSPAPPDVPPNPHLGRQARPRGMTHDEHVQSLGRTPHSQRRPLLTPSSLLPSGDPETSPVQRREQNRRRSGSENLARPLRHALSLQDTGRRTSSRPPMRGGPDDGAHTLTSSRVSAISSLYRSSSTGEDVSGSTGPPSEPSYPKELISLLDGEHHTDELSTRFEKGWPHLEQWLAEIGGGQGEGDFGRVIILYR